MAELNPVPVAIGAAVLLLLVGLLILQRKRAKGTRRTRPKPDAKKAKPAPITTATAPGPTVTERVAPTTPVVAEALVSPAVSAAAVAPAIIAATPVVTERGAPPEPRAAVAAPVSRDATRQERVAQVAEEVKKLMAGGDYDQNVVASDDRDTRQLVGAELLSALVGRNIQRRERARAAFMQHGYFDDATRDLRIAESANERAAAARRLSFAHDREATPHLIAALDDSAPDVRRAAVEALMDMRDPAAIAPLNSLMQTENDRKVPRTLIKHAIEACATNGPQVDTPVAASLPAAPVSHPSSPPVEPDREVIEL